MARVGTTMLGNSTGNSLGVDDVQCCSAKIFNLFETFLLSQPHIPMWQFCSPVIILFGTFGNIMTIVIIRRMSEGQSSNSMFLYFTALAVSDVILLYTGIFRKWLSFVWGIYVKTLHISLCRLLQFFVYTCGTISAWLLVSMTMQRVVSVVWPHRKSLSCTKTKVGFVITAIVAVPSAINSYKLFSYEIPIRPNSTSLSCYITDEQLAYYDLYIYPWIDLSLSSIIPFVLLIIGNSVLVWKVIQSVQVARVMTAGGGDQVNSRQKKASSLTVTLITVSLVFLCLSLPICMYYIILPDMNTDTSLSLAKVSFFYAVVDISYYANSAINFYLYCLSGTRFRNELKNVFCGRSPALKMSTVVSATDDTTRSSKFHREEERIGSDF